jgi:hypothetical protein
MTLKFKICQIAIRMFLSSQRTVQKHLAQLQCDVEAQHTPEKEATQRFPETIPTRH